MASFVLFLSALASQSVHSFALVRLRQDIRLGMQAGLDPRTQNVSLDLATGAACLDGSPYVFRITPALDSSTTRWTLHLDTGSPCETEEECVEKTQSVSGSSLFADPEAKGCTCVNSDADGNTQDCVCIDILSCDAGYLMSHRDESLWSDGTELVMRGRDNLKATLDYLKENLNLADATEVVVSGHSSGGIMALLNLDYIAGELSSSTKVFGVPIAGFTLERETCCEQKNTNTNTCSKGCYNDYTSNIYTLHNLSSSLTTGCLDYHSDEPHKCLIGSFATAAVKTPMFFLQSMYDAWQLYRIEGLDFQSIYNEQGGCGDLKAETIAYGEVFMKQFDAAYKAQNSAYITRCVCHAACDPSGLFLNAESDDGTPVRKLIGQWWAGNTTGYFADDHEPTYECDVDGQV